MKCPNILQTRPLNEYQGTPHLPWPPRCEQLPVARGYRVGSPWLTESEVSGIIGRELVFPIDPTSHSAAVLTYAASKLQALGSVPRNLSYVQHLEHETKGSPILIFVS